jgi:hypothetical protein
MKGFPNFQPIFRPMEARHASAIRVKIYKEDDENTDEKFACVCVCVPCVHSTT